MEILYVVTLAVVVLVWRYHLKRLNKLESEFVDYQIVAGQQLSQLIEDIVKLQGNKKVEKEPKKGKVKKSKPEKK